MSCDELDKELMVPNECFPYEHVIDTVTATADLFNSY